MHVEHDLDPARTSFPARLDVVDGRLPNAERDEWPSGQRNEVGSAGEDHSRGQRQADGVFAFEEDALAQFPALELQPAQLKGVFDVPFRGVRKIQALLDARKGVYTLPAGPLCQLILRFEPAISQQSPRPLHNWGHTFTLALLNNLDLSVASGCCQKDWRRELTAWAASGVAQRAVSRLANHPPRRSSN